MSAAAVSTNPVLCLGEALVDMVGERPVRSLREVGRFAPHFGGTVANVAVVAARAGAPIALAGGAGADEWGHWLQRRLVAEGVDTSRFTLVPDAQTQLAFVAVDADGEPSYELYTDATPSLVHALGAGVERAVAPAGGLLIGSNTLAAEPERALTMRAREHALALGRPVVFDCNLRLHRWSSRADAAASANACVPGALLVRANRAEAELMTGERDPERAAVALRKAGARLVAITLGADGAILRGAASADVAAGPAQVRNTAGAGDAFTGTLLARLALSGFAPAAAAEAMG
ncbi:MAG: PfkB family carbohydrate kinase, partial [Solirubrobacteraceae bacterium]